MSDTQGRGPYETLWLEERAEVKRLTAEVERLRELLRELEWVDYCRGGGNCDIETCPFCFAYKPDGEPHRPDCRLANALQLHKNA